MSSPGHVEQELSPESQNVRPLLSKGIHGRPESHGQLQLAVLGSAVIVAALVVAWLALNRPSNTTSRPAQPSGPALVSQAELEGLAATPGKPVYWAGPKPGYGYELTLTPGGRTYIRYLPSGSKAGDPRADFLTVATYPQAKAFATLSHAARQPGSIAAKIDQGGIAVFSSKRTSNVYFAYPGSHYEVEVFSPSGDTARTLVLAGKIAPIR